MTVRTKPPIEEIYQREFARRDRCSETRVRRGIKTGHLNVLPSGKLDAAQVGGPWRERNRRGADTPANISANNGANKPDVRTGVRSPDSFSADLPPGETAEEFAARAIREGGAPFSHPEAERIKENYIALLRQLEFDTKSGAVVLVADVAKAVGAEYAKVRTRLLSIPAEQAPRIQRLKTVAEVEDTLRSIITEALEELTMDRSA
jgi:hypothetical protein